MRPRASESRDADRIGRRIKAALASGTSQQDIARAMGVSAAVISRHVKAMRERGELPR